MLGDPTLLLPSGITTNQVCGAIGYALLRDLTVNNFAFQGFPEIQATFTEDAFDVTLRIGTAIAGPFSLDEQVGTEQAKLFAEGEPVSNAFSKTVQDWIVELESAAE